MNILDLFKMVKHRGHNKGRKYRVWSILSLSLLGLLCNQNTIESIHRFGIRLSKKVRRDLGFGLNMPCSRSISWNLKMIDCRSLEEMISRHLAVRSKRRVIHIDGKVLRDSATQQAPALHVVSAFVSQISSVVTREFVAPNENEISVALRLMDNINIACSIITGDAIFTQQNVVQKIVKKKCYFVLPVKRNQPNLQDEIRDAFDRYKMMYRCGKRSYQKVMVG